MPKRRRRGERRKKLDDAPYLFFVGLIGYVSLQPKYGTVVFVLFCVTVLMLWVMFVMATWCDYDLGDRGCSRRVYGKLRGCGQHSRLKRDAMFATFGRRNPGMLLRLTWTNTDHHESRRRPATAGAPAQTGERSEANAKQGSYNAAMLMLTAISAAAAIVIPFIAG